VTPQRALTEIARAAADLDIRLLGDDSPLANPWEEIKEQVQHGPSPYWPIYQETLRQLTGSFVTQLPLNELDALKAALKVSTQEAVERKLTQRLLRLAQKEKIDYAPFDFSYFCYALLNFTCYGRVIDRTGLNECYARVFSGAAPMSEYGTIDCSRIEGILTENDFEEARAAGWPARWPAS